MKFKLIALVILSILLTGCSTYYRLMGPAIKAKKVDPNPNPIFDGEVEPPLPNLSSITPDELGVDSNKNGIRDDIDIWINRTGKDYEERMALRQYARASERFLYKCRYNQEDGDIQKIVYEWNDSHMCIKEIFSRGGKEIKNLDELPDYYMDELYGLFYSKVCWDYLNQTGPSFRLRGSDKSYQNCRFKIMQEI